MSGMLPSIDLGLVRKLQDRGYRQSFFIAESSALIAKQLIQLRKRRGLNQKQVAEALDTGQPAISRVERADYRNWSFNTLRRLAEALDARLRIYIEPSEDVLPEYEEEEIEYRHELAKLSDLQNAKPQQDSYDQKSSGLGSLSGKPHQDNHINDNERPAMLGNEVGYGVN